MNSIKFIETPDQLNDMDMDLLRGGKVASNDCPCNGGSAFACGTYTK